MFVVGNMAKANLYKKTYDNTIPLSNAAFQKIIRFYLFECPAESRSFRGKSLAAYGWKNRWPLENLRKRMIEASVGNLDRLFFSGLPDKLPAKLKEAEGICPCNEYCVFLSNEEKSAMQSLFAAIRNSFAHGSFAVRRYKDDGGHYQRMYFLCNYDGYLKAELVLNEKTLLAWIPIVINGP